MRRWATGIALGLLATLLITEGMLRVVMRDRDFLERLGRNSEAGKRAMGLAQQAATGVNAHFSMAGVAFDPDLGWVGEPSAPRTGPDGEPLFPVVTHGPDGLRISAPPGWTPAVPGVEIAVIGDSFTYGFEASDDGTWAWQLREALGVEVRNYSLVGFGLDQVLLRWRRDVAPTQPDAFVVGMNELLLTRLTRSWDSWAKPRFAQDGEGLTLTGVPVPAPDALAWRWWTPRLGVMLDVYLEAIRPSEAKQTELRPVALGVMALLVEEVTATDTTLVLLDLPTPGMVDAPNRGPSLEGDVMALACDHPRVICVSALDAMVAAEAAGVDVRARSHWNAAGNQVVAEVLAEALRPVVLPDATE